MGKGQSERTEKTGLTRGGVETREAFSNGSVRGSELMLPPSPNPCEA